MQTVFIDYLEYLFFNNLNSYYKKLFLFFIYSSMKLNKFSIFNLSIFIMNSVIIALHNNIFMIKII